MKLWIRRTLLASGLLFLCFKLIRTVNVLVRIDGFSALFTDGVTAYSLGEALVLGSLLVYATMSGAREIEGRSRMIQWLRWPLWFGAVLTALGWWDLRLRAPWSWWPLVLTMIGALAPFVVQWLSRSGRRWPGRVLAGLVVLAYFLSYAHSFLSTGYSFAPVPSAPRSAAQSRIERWQQDLAYLQTEMPRMHVNAYHSVTPGEFNQAASNLAAALPSMEDHQAIVGLMQFAALVGDAHSGIDLQPAMGFRRYPLRLSWFKDGLYVFGATAEQTDLIGMRVTGIGEADIEEAFDEVSSLITHENDSWLLNQSQNYLVTAEVLHALDLIANMDQAEFSFQSPDGLRVTHRLSPLTEDSEADWHFANSRGFLYQRDQDLNFWYEYLPEDQILYFKYNACVPFGFWRFNRALWRVVDENPVQKIVVDFRDNGGGSSFQFRFFLDELAKRPEFDDPQRLFAVTNRSTFSSAMMNALQMQSQTEATLLGEPTGGKPNSYGEVRAFRLPNSGLRVTYSTRYFQEVEDELLSVMPDVPLSMTFADFQSGRDPVLEWLQSDEN